MAKLKLTRREYVVLKHIRDNDTTIGSGATDAILNKLVIHQLIIPIAIGVNACRYKISGGGTKYLIDNEAPAIKMTEPQAATIYSLLNGKTYDCAPAFYEYSQTFDRLIEIQAVEPDELEPKKFRLTADGRDAFEKTSYGEMHIRRIEENEKIDEFEAWFKESEFVNLDTKSARLKKAAELARVRGLDAYAERILAEAEKVAKSDAVLSIIHRHVSVDDRVVKLTWRGSDISRISFDSEFYIHLDRIAYADSWTPALGRFHLEKGYISLDGSHENPAGRLEDFANNVIVAIRIMQDLNTEYLGGSEELIPLEGN